MRFYGIAFNKQPYKEINKWKSFTTHLRTPCR